MPRWAPHKHFLPLEKHSDCVLTKTACVHGTILRRLRDSSTVQVVALQTAAAEQNAAAAADLARHVAVSQAALAGARTDAAAAVARAQQDCKAAAARAAAEAAAREEGVRARIDEAAAQDGSEATARENAVRLELGDALAAARAQAAEATASLHAAAAASGSTAEAREDRARSGAAEAEVKRLKALLMESAAEVAALRGVVLVQCQEREGWRHAHGSSSLETVQKLAGGAVTSYNLKREPGAEQKSVGRPGAEARWGFARPARVVRQRLGRHYMA